MKPSLLQRLLHPGTAGAGGVRGTTVVREERGSGAGAVLFQPYAVKEFIPDPDATPTPDEPREERRAPASRETNEPSPTAAETAPESTRRAHAVLEPRRPNPVAEEWRRTSPDVFLSIAQRFCARAPKAAEELREYCLAGESLRLGKLATSLKPTLSLFDSTAGDAADRVERLVAEGRVDGLPLEVLALEHEVWRVAAAWADAARATAVANPVAS
ncbi:MAG: hypothetical protein IT178_12750 [Acidobacteria bacterium]|nr:hypothetical protein [Acidobacteriota bacterium]